MPYNRNSVRICGNCNSEFHPEFNTNHCEKCRHVHKKCKRCRKEFSVPRSHNRVEFCSISCAGLDRWKDAITKRGERRPPCSYCGKPITRQYWDYTHKKENHFCDRECYRLWRIANPKIGGEFHPRWTGGYDGYYGRSWKRQRKLARERDKVCQRCGKTPEENGKALDVHHVKPFRDFGIEREKEAHDLSNLTCYCSNCHSSLEWEIYQG